MSDLSQQPSISIIIPTLNSERVLNDCLESVFSQDYPHELLEILIIDAGSDDDTLSIVTAFSRRKGPDIKVLSNPLKTGEAGKAVGTKNASNEILAFIDSDNILPEPGWLQKMVEPFNDSDILAAEPLEYIYRRRDGFITRYCALIGMNDPFCLFKGNYDRFSYLTNHWTEMPLEEEEMENYLKVKPDPQNMPTFGANGFFIRRQVLLDNFSGDYLFDIDVLIKTGRKNDIKIAKVKTGIIHIFSGDIRTFIKKQRRRIQDYLYFKKINMRAYNWNRKKGGTLKFCIYCILIFPLLFQALTGYLKKRDSAWCFHPLACWITFYTYSINILLFPYQTSEIKRINWR